MPAIQALPSEGYRLLCTVRMIRRRRMAPRPPHPPKNALRRQAHLLPVLRFSPEPRASPASNATSCWARFSPPRLSRTQIPSAWSKAPAASPTPMSTPRRPPWHAVCAAWASAPATSSACGCPAAPACSSARSPSPRPARPGSPSTRTFAVDRVAVCLGDCATPRRFSSATFISPKAHGRSAVRCPVVRKLDLVDARPTRAWVDARAAGCTPDHPAYHDLHVRLDRHAQGHRRFPAATSATTCALPTRSTACTSTT